MHQVSHAQPSWSVGSDYGSVNRMWHLLEAPAKVLVVVLEPWRLLPVRPRVEPNEVNIFPACGRDRGKKGIRVEREVVVVDTCSGGWWEQTVGYRVALQGGACFV